MNGFVIEWIADIKARYNPRHAYIKSWTATKKGTEGTIMIYQGDRIKEIRFDYSKSVAEGEMARAIRAQGIEVI